MRRIVDEQQRLVPIAVAHTHARELRAISDQLDAMPETLEWIYADLTAETKASATGRVSMTAEQVLRALIIKQMNGFSYEQLAFHLADSFSYRAFCRLGFDARGTPSKSALHRSIKLIQANTLEKVNARLLVLARQLGVEDGSKVRVDCTVEETNIHEPTDSALLWDCVRVLVRLTRRAQQYVDVPLVEHTRRAKRRAIGIQNAGRQARRLPLYRDLLKVTQRTLGYALHAMAMLVEHGVGSDQQQLLAEELERYISLTRRVISQTQRRVLGGESVPSAEKVVSIFEPHTDIIRKDRRNTLYGHKLCLATGPSGLFLDCVVHQGNPADSTLTVSMVQRLRCIYQHLPRQVSFDGGFSSKANLKELKGLGVGDVVFAKSPGIAIDDMASSPTVYRTLRRFRAGIEAGISFLKRSFGLTRCNWRGFASFKAYTWSAIISANLLLLARHQLAA